VAEATVLIPAFNEEATVGRVVRVAREAGFPVVVADDGSKDETARRALEAGAEVVRLKENRGKGGAIAEGLKAVRTPFVLLLDADLLGLRPEHLFALLKPLKEGVRVPAGRFNAYRLRVAFTTERGGADVKLLYLVPGLGVVAFQAGEGLVGLVRFSAP